MSFRVSKEEPGFVLSSVVHVALLVVGLLGLADAKTFEDAQESVPVEFITESQLKQITQGEKTAKQVLPDAKLRVDKVAPEQKQDDPGEKKQDLAAPQPAPALPPVRPVELAKSEPQKAEPKKAEPVELPPSKPQIVPPLAPALPPVRPAEIPKPEPVKKAAAQPSQDDDEADPEAEIIRQAAKKSPIPRKEDAPKTDSKLVEQQKAEDARKKAEEAKKEELKKLAELKKAEEQKQAAEVKRVADAEAKKLADAKNLAEARAEEQRKADEAKQAEAKKAAELKKVADAKAADAAADTAADAAEKAKAEAKVKAEAEAKKKALAAKAAADAEARRQAEFNKLLKAKLASAAAANGGNGQQLPSDRLASATGSTGAQINRTPSSLGAPSATGAKLNPAERAGLSEAVADQVSPKVSYTGDKPKVLPQFKVTVGRDGSLVGQPQLANSSSDPSFQALAAAGARAIRAAAPFRIEARYASTYEDWKNMIIQINPDY